MCSQPRQAAVAPASPSGERMALPTPQREDPGDISVEEALASRRSHRAYEPASLTLTEVSQLLWAAQGISYQPNRRTTPSAGALYPLEVYLVAGDVEGLDRGVYHYVPQEHGLVRTLVGDKRSALRQAALDQEALHDVPAVIALAAVYDRTTAKYGQRGRQYVHMEVGAAAQNVYLQAEALDLGTVMMGAFHDDPVRDVLQLPDDQQPLALLPLGHPRPAE